MKSMWVVRRRIGQGNQLRRWLILLTIALAMLGTLVGFVSYLSRSLLYDPLLAPNTWWKHVLDAASDALALLVFETASRVPDTAYFPIARVLSAVATVGGVLLFAWESIVQSWWALRVSALSNHTVVIGIGERGRALLQTISPNESLVLVDRSDDIWPVAARSKRTYAVIGDAKNTETLFEANVGNAKTILILGGDDDENLAIHRAVLEHTMHRTRTHIIVRIDNPSLARALNAERRFTDPDAKHRVVAFNEDRLAVLRMFESHVMGELAEFRGLRRQHLVVVGHTGFALEAMEHFVRLSPYKDFAIPRIDMLSANPKTTRKRLAAMRPAMLAHACIHTDDGSIEWKSPVDDTTRPLVELHIWPIDGQSGLPEAVRLRQIEPGPEPSVTAILVSAEDDSHAVAIALRLRSIKRAEDRWSAPIFVRAENDAAVRFVKEPPSRLLADRIHPVGLVEEIASLDEYVEERDSQARRFHESWLKAESPQFDRGARTTSVEWPVLPNSAKARNRRAVDHLRSKLYSAGYVVLPGPPKANHQVFCASTEMDRELALLEHKAWETDLRLDGWRNDAVRNDAARRHDLLDVPYEHLDPRIRGYDHRQLWAASDFLFDEGIEFPTVCRDTRIAMIGHLDVSPASRDKMLEAIPDVLTSYARKGEHLEFVSILTPLAPGADTIGAEVLIDALKQRRIPYRLIVVEAHPRHAMLHHALSGRTPGSAWSLHGPPLPLDDEEAMRLVMNYQDGLAPHFQSAGSTSVDLQPPGIPLSRWMNDQSLRIEALRRANAYMMQRADVVIALARDLRHEPKPGGTREALNWAQKVEPVPPEFAHYGGWWVRRGQPTVHTITPVADGGHEVG